MVGGLSAIIAKRRDFTAMEFWDRTARAQSSQTSVLLLQVETPGQSSSLKQVIVHR